MSESARIDDIDAMKSFRVQLAKFADAANLALDDAQSDVNRALNWLEGEQLSFWTTQIRKRQELLARAEQALRDKTLYKDISGRPPSAVEEHKAVAVAKRNLEEAEQKLANTKSWCRRFPKEIAMYYGGVKPLANTLAGGVPAALAQMTNALNWLEQYIAAPQEAGSTGGSPPEGGGDSRQADSMARGVGQAHESQPDRLLLLRQAIPTETELADAAALPADHWPLPADETFAWAAAPAATEVAESTDDVKIVMAAEFPPTAGIVVCRVNTQLIYIGPEIYDGNKNQKPALFAAAARDIVNDRPYIGQLLLLPVGTLALVGSDGRATVYDARNRRLTGAD